MGVEGGGSSHPDYRRTPENFGNVESGFGRSIEPRPETESESWLSGIIDPEKLARFREYPALAEHSDEWIIMEALLGRLVEHGAEMNPAIRTRLRNLVGVLRMAFYPNMQEREQRFVRDLLTQTTTVDFSSLTYDVNTELHEDMRWIWGTFGLDVPTENQRDSMPANLYQMLNQPRVEPKPSMAIEIQAPDDTEKQDLKLKAWSPKKRRLCRLLGLFDAGIGIGVEVILLEDLPIEMNDPALRYIAYGSLGLSFIPAYFVLNGIIDAIKGTHHYLGLTIWKKLSRNPETKLRLQEEIDIMTGKTDIAE